MYIWKNEQKWTLKNPEDFNPQPVSLRRLIAE